MVVAGQQAGAAGRPEVQYSRGGMIAALHLWCALLDRQVMYE